MPNLINTDTIIAESLMVLQHVSKAAQYAGRDVSADWNFRGEFGKGDKVPFETPGDAQIVDFDDENSSETIQIQDISNGLVEVEITDHPDTSCQLTSKELALDIKLFSSRVLEPRIKRMAEYIDGRVASTFDEASNLVIADPASLAGLAAINKAATVAKINDPRFGLVSLDTEEAMLASHELVQASSRGDRGVEISTSAALGRAYGINWDSIAQFPAISWTAGTTAANVLADTNPGATSITLDAIAAAKAGDRLIVAGCATQLVVAADSVTADVTLTNPTTEFIAAGSAVTTVGSGQAITVDGIVFDSRAVAVAMPALDEVDGGTTRYLSHDGFGMRAAMQYDINKKVTILSLDALLGVRMVEFYRALLIGSAV